MQRVELGDALLCLLRGALVVMYGDEVGMIGSGGDKAAREDMFPTQVTDWQAEPRVASAPIGTGSSPITTNPLEAQLAALANLRIQHPALSTGALVVRVAKEAVLVVSRIDAATGKELVTACNNGISMANVTFKTATPAERGLGLLIRRPPLIADRTLRSTYRNKNPPPDVKTDADRDKRAISGGSRVGSEPASRPEHKSADVRRLCRAL